MTKKINKLANVLDSHSTPAQISVIVYLREAAWARVTKSRRYSIKITVVYITVCITSPGGWFSIRARQSAGKRSTAHSLG